jgi:hypothetical protein
MAQGSAKAERFVRIQATVTSGRAGDRPGSSGRQSMQEDPMPTAHVIPSGDCLLRIVFNHRVLSLGLAAGATFGDIARTLRTIPKKYGNPLAIDVTVAGRDVGRRLVFARPARTPESPI